MTDGARLLIKWLTDNVLVTYQEPVSSKAKLPYISLGYTDGNFGEPYVQQLSIWTRSDSSYSQAYQIADKLDKLIGDNGILIKDEKTTMWLKRGSPFMQNRNDPDLTIKAVFVNLEISKY